MLQDVPEFRGTISRVDIHQDDSHTRGGHLEQHPFHVVGRPDPNAVTLGESDAEQTLCQLVYALGELGVGQPLVLRQRDDGFPVPEPVSDQGKMFRNCLTQQGRGTARMVVTAIDE